MVISFTTLTLAIGSPMYDKLSESVEREFGEVPELDEPARVGVARAVRQSAALIATSALGRDRAVRLRIHSRARADPGSGRVGHLRRLDAGDRAGRFDLRASRSGQAGRPARGDAAPPRCGCWVWPCRRFLLLAIPFVGVLVFPIATAAGTLLARQLLGEPTVGSGAPAEPVVARGWFVSHLEMGTCPQGREGSLPSRWESAEERRGSASGWSPSRPHAVTDRRSGSSRRALPDQARGGDPGLLGPFAAVAVDIADLVRRWGTRPRPGRRPR